MHERSLWRGDFVSEDGNGIMRVRMADEGRDAVHLTVVDLDGKSGATIELSLNAAQQLADCLANIDTSR